VSSPQDTPPRTQESLIQSLKEAAVYPHPVDEVECIETHISWILLAGEYVYKIKKAVNLGFVDFTTLERRRFFCAEEIRLNRRHAADLYLDVVTISGKPSAPDLTGSGTAIEYAVRMRRFDTRDGFDQMLVDGHLTRQHVKALARQLAELHQNAEVADPQDGHGTPEQVAAPMRDNLAALKELLSTSADQQRMGRLEHWTEYKLERLAPVLARRLRDGFVRECHGDAHLGNVTLFNDQTTLFDCIEFDAELRWIDVINDLAFTIMDLRDRDGAALSWLLLDEYLTRTGDFEGLELLGLYIVYRALVRAKVLALQLADSDLPEDQRQKIATEIQGYLELGEATMSPPQPKLVITLGVSGSGKSWMAERLLQACGLVRLRSDVERKRLFELGAEDDSDSGLSAGIYSREATESTYAAMRDTAESLLRQDFSVIVDATFTRQSQRDAFRQLAGRLNVPFRLLHCQADETVLRKRIRARNSEGNDPSEAGLDVLEGQLKSFEPPVGDELEKALVVDTNDPESLDQATAWLRR